MDFLKLARTLDEEGVILHMVVEGSLDFELILRLILELILGLIVAVVIHASSRRGGGSDRRCLVGYGGLGGGHLRRAYEG